jgi:hypothetical protein
MATWSWKVSMPASDELGAAVSAGVIGQAEADRLAAFLATYRAGRPQAEALETEDAEAIRFVRGFHDVFLTIGVTLLLIGIGSTAEILASGAWPYPIAIAAWALAEYFTRIKRLMLPSVVLSVAFGITGGLLFSAVGLALYGVSGEIIALTNRFIVLPPVTVAIGILAASVLFYLRFRLPFTLAQIVVAASYVIRVVLGNEYSTPFLLLIVGLLTFTAALLFDLKDRERRTIASDNAFWLHLTAAPLIVHTTIGFVQSETVASWTLPMALAILGVICGLALIALLIDRRALLVAGLFYFGAALFVLIRNTAIESNAVFAVTILILGVSLLLLGVGWRILRRLAVETLMPSVIARRLPTLRPS